MQSKIISVLVFISFSNYLFSQNNQYITIRGVVSDSLSQEPLIGANIYIEDRQMGTTTAKDGSFSLQIPQADCTLLVSYVGYEPYSYRIEPNGIPSVLNIKLSQSKMLEEVVVTAQKANRNITDINTGIEKLSIGEIKKLPVLMGEVDIIKAVQLLPGIQATSEGGAGFSVRGSSPDQNLILLDNTTIYNASHLLGFFSVFNNDVISGLELYKGDIPVQYGGCLSSLLDIKTINDHPEQITGSGGLGLISSRLMLRGHLGEKTTWLIGGRRSYLDLFLGLSDDEELKNTSLYFYDINAKIDHRLSAHDRFSLNFYIGKDNFDMDMLGFNYGNLASSFSWMHTFTDNHFSKFSINASKYNYGLKTDIEGAKADWKFSISDITFHSDFKYYISSFLNLSYGLSSAIHRFDPGNLATEDYPDYKVPVNYGLEHGVYASNEHELSKSITLRYGLRYSLFQNIGKATVYKYGESHEIVDNEEYGKGEIYHTYGHFDPRASLVYKLTSNSSVKANYSHNTQYIQMASASSASSPLDLWFSVSPNIKPQTVDIFSGGYYHNFQNNSFEFSTEIYYKSFDNVIDFTDHPDLLLNKQLEGEVRSGKGKAYGIEFTLKKNIGEINGFINYTLSRSERTIPEINNGKTYLSPYDKTHFLNIVTNWQLSKKWDLSAAWIYSTGAPTTYPTGRFNIGEEYFPIYSDRNTFRKPDYHRLDLSATYRMQHNKKKGWRSEWSFSLYNAYGRKNPYMITYDQNKSTGIPYAESTYLFRFIPSVTYNFKF
jgi:outer membrane cobalamin receptor